MSNIVKLHKIITVMRIFYMSWISVVLWN